MIITINDHQTSLTKVTHPLYRSLIISLFSWRRAKPNDDSDRPYGWWGDCYPSINNDMLGSRLYLLTRAKLTNDTANFAKIYIKEALQWMIDDGLVSNLDIDVKRTDLAVLSASITLHQASGSKESIKFNNLWSDLHGK